MINKQKSIEYIKNKFPDALCELNYTTELDLLIAVLLSAQTTDKLVNTITKDLFKKYKTVYDYNEVGLNELTKDISKIGLANTKAKHIKELAKRLIEVYNSKIPSKKEELVTLSGVGNKTANVFLSVIYNMPLMAVDTHVKRVSVRLYFATEKDSVDIIEKKIYKLVKKEDISRFHHQMIFFGRYHCTARNPKCSECELTTDCRYFKGSVKNVKKD